MSAADLAAGLSRPMFLRIAELSVLGFLIPEASRALSSRDRLHPATFRPGTQSKMFTHGASISEHFRSLVPLGL